MVNGVSNIGAGDVISEEQRSELVSDPSVVSVRTSPADDEGMVEVQDIEFREPEQAPTRTPEKEAERQEDISEAEAEDTEQVEQAQRQVEQRIEETEQQLQQVKELGRRDPVRFGGETIEAQQAEQALEQRRTELEQLRGTIGEDQAFAQVEDAPVTEGGIDVETVADVPAPVTEPFDREQVQETRETLRDIPVEARRDIESIESPEETARQQGQEQIPTPLQVEEQEQIQEFEQQRQRRREQAELREQFFESTELLTPSQLRARQQSEQLQDVSQQREQVQNRLTRINEAQEQGVETVVVNGEQLPIGEARERLERRELELRAQEDVTQQRILETIDITEPPTRQEAIALEVERLEDLPTRQLATRFAGELAEFTGTSAAELGAETVTTAAGLGLGDELFDTRRPEPDLREEFRDLTPSLIAAQQRGGEIGAALSDRLPEGTEREAAEFTLDVLGSTLPGGIAVTQLPQSQVFTQRQFARFPEALGAEIPEAATELGGGLAVAERTIEAPGETLATGVRGAGQIAGQFVSEPTQFFQTEIVPDVGLDIVTGSVAPTVLPEASRVVPDREQITDVLTRRRTGQMGTTDTIKTVEPDVVTDVGPDTPTPEPDIDLVEPGEPATPQVEPVTEPVTQPQQQTRPDVVARPQPVTEPVSRPDAVTRPEDVTDVFTRPEARPQTRSQSLVGTEPVTEPVVETQVQVQPQVQPRPRPQPRPRTVVRPDVDEDIDAVTGSFAGDGTGGRGTERTPSLGAVLQGVTEEPGDVRTEFTGLEQRPVIEDVDDDDGDVEEELTGLF